MIKCLFKDNHPSYRNRIDYVLNFICQHPIIQGKMQFSRDQNTDYDSMLSYGIHQVDSFFVPAQKLLFSSNTIQLNDLSANKYPYQSIQLYSVELIAKTSEPFFIDNHFQFDLIETIFFHITRMEEWYCDDKDLDQWDMMQSSKHFLVRHQLHQIPVVDHLIFAFAKAIGLDVSPKETTFRITHDIDEIQKKKSLYKTIRASAGTLWRRPNISSLVRVWSSYFSKQKNPYDTFNWMLSANDQIEKYIYFLVGGHSKYDTPYPLDTDRVKAIFQLCKKRGYNIGLHPSYESWQDENLFQKEKEKLENQINQSVIFSRQHYLHFDFKKTNQILGRQKIKEDSTLGFNDRIGFRCGTGFGYHLYNFEEEKAYNYIETPLVCMDSALFWETGYEVDKIKKLWNEFLLKNSHHTKITFNFHNSRFYDAWIHGIPLKEMYEELIKSKI